MRTLGRASDELEIRRRLGAVRPDSARRWGRMTAHQMLCHVADAFRMALGDKAVTPSSGWLQRTIVKWIALYAPLHWPSGTVTSPEIDQALGGCRPTDFAADGAQLEALVERFVSESASLAAQRHPVFGAMSTAAWLRWGYLHVDHHLRQFGA